MTDLQQPLSIIEPFTLEEIGGEFFLIHKHSANMFHLNSLSKLYLECLQQGIAKQHIISAVTSRFNMALSDVESDFDVFLSSLGTANTSKTPLNKSLRLLEPTEFLAYPSEATASTVTYSAGGIAFNISCADAYCLRMIAARLALMRVAVKPTDSACNIAVISGKNGFAIQVEGQTQVAAEDNNWLDVLVMQAMLDQISLRSSNTVILHAAAVANDKGEAVIFAAASGAGKSTLATFLALNGYEYLGDDLVLLKPANAEIMPFRTQPNLKPGSWPLFDKALAALKNQEIFRPTIKPVKFAGITAKPLQQSTYKVKALVFPEFNSAAEAAITPLNLADSFAYLAEIRHNTGQANLASTARQLIEFTHNTPCFALRYRKFEELQPQRFF